MNDASFLNFTNDRVLAGFSQTIPNDTFNRELISNVHPTDWINPKPSGRYNLVVIGAGTAGLVTAVGSAGLGAKVALIERSLMGGDCLNVGCVPSKGVFRPKVCSVQLARWRASRMRNGSVSMFLMAFR